MVRRRLLSIALLSVGLSQEDSSGVVRVQRSLFITLGGWAGANIATGSWQAFSARSSEVQRYMGYQALGWGAVNGTIAGIGALMAHRQRSHPKNWRRERQRIRRLLWINVGLDVGYIGAGALLASQSDGRLRGTGYGIMLQGGGLLVIDTWHALRLKER